MTYHCHLFAHNLNFWPAEVLERDYACETRAVKEVPCVRKAVDCQSYMPNL